MTTPDRPKRTPLKLVTIVAEAVLEDRLLQDLRALGARGWTTSRVHGEGSRGTRTSGLEGGNVRIETLVAPDLADRLLDHLADHYFAHFALVAFAQTVEVVRGDKYA